MEWRPATLATDGELSACPTRTSTPDIPTQGDSPFPSILKLDPEASLEALADVQGAWSDRRSQRTLPIKVPGPPSAYSEIIRHRPAGKLTHANAPTPNPLMTSRSAMNQQPPRPASHPSSSFKRTGVVAPATFALPTAVSRHQQASGRKLPLAPAKAISSVSSPRTHSANADELLSFTFVTPLAADILSVGLSGPELASRWHTYEGLQLPAPQAATPIPESPWRCVVLGLHSLLGCNRF